MATSIASIVIPIHNEEHNIPILYAGLTAVFETFGKYAPEIIFVDDGSTDGSWQAIAALAVQDPRVRGVSFSRNFGNQYAFEAGLNIARGDIVITMDGNLQHPAELIPALIAKYDEGNEIVTTRRLKYHKAPWPKKFASNLFYRIYNAIADVPIGHSSCDFMLLSRRVVDTLNSIDEAERFYRGLVQWLGFSHAVVEFVPNNRINGRSSYTLGRQVNLMWTALTSFSTLPLKFISVLGLFMTIGGMGTLAVGWARHQIFDLAEMAALMVLCTGLILTALGIVAIYLLRVYREVQKRPNYLIAKRANVAETTE